MGFNSGFKGLNVFPYYPSYQSPTVPECTLSQLAPANLMNDCIKTIGYSVLCKLTNKLTNKNQRKAISASIFLQLKHHRLTQPPKYNKKSDLTQTAKPRQNNKERANLQAYQIQAECYFPSSLLLQANVCREMFFSAKIMSAFPLISICPEHQNFTKFHQLHNTV